MKVKFEPIYDVTGVIFVKKEKKYWWSRWKAVTRPDGKLQYFRKYGEYYLATKL